MAKTPPQKSTSKYALYRKARAKAAGTKPVPPKKKGPSLAKYSADETYVDNWGHKGQGVRKSTRKAANRALKTMFPTRKKK